MTVESVPSSAETRKARRGIQLQASAIIWLAVAALLILSYLVSPNFVDASHLLNVARQASALGVLAIGQTYVLITGGIDLSNGMMITLVNVIAATLLKGSDQNLGWIVLLCLGIGMALGLVNGVLITRLKAPPLVVTLGMFSVVRGLAYVYTQGAPKGDVSPGLEFVGAGFVGPIPTAIFVWIGCTILGVILLNRTVFGRQLFAVGGNDRAARLSGVHTQRMTILAYVLSGLAAAIAGLLLTGYIGTGSMTIGDGMNLNSVAAAVVGGTVLAGGVGSVTGTAGGALFLTLLFSFLRFINLPYSSQLMVEGVILAVAAYAQLRARR